MTDAHGSARRPSSSGHTFSVNVATSTTTMLQGARRHDDRNHASDRARNCRSHDRAFSQITAPELWERVGGSRFLETDPIEGGTSNDYTYVDDPLNQFDLDGMACRSRDSKGKILETTRAAAPPGRNGRRLDVYLKCGTSGWGWRHIRGGADHVRQFGYGEDTFRFAIRQTLTGPTRIIDEKDRGTWAYIAPIGICPDSRCTAPREYRFTVVVSKRTGNIITAFAGR